MTRVRNIVCVLALVIILYILITLDYTELSWSVNRPGYTGLLSAGLTAVAMLISNRQATKK